MTTKQRIIQQAIEMFNEAGGYHIGVKEIAKEMGMSPGNFTYHFPRKTDLLLAIQQQMLADARVPIWDESVQQIGLTHFEQLFRSFHKIQQRYSFYFNNLLYTFKTFPEMAEVYRKTTKERFRQGVKLIDYYIDKGTIKPKPMIGSYQHLMKSLWMVSIFWTGQQVVLGAESLSQEADNQMEVLWSIFLPHLTPKGLEEYYHLCEQKQQTSPMTNVLFA